MARSVHQVGPDCSQFILPQTDDEHPGALLPQTSYVGSGTSHHALASYKNLPNLERKRIEYAILRFVRLKKNALLHESFFPVRRECGKKNKRLCMCCQAGGGKGRSLSESALRGLYLLGPASLCTDASF
jgi:hypothetical protein